eukprot:2942188-Pleurochrysis_carterae.AAC.3
MEPRICTTTASGRSVLRLNSIAFPLAKEIGTYLARCWADAAREFRKVVSRRQVLVRLSATRRKRISREQLPGAQDGDWSEPATEHTRRHVNVKICAITLRKRTVAAAHLLPLILKY